MKRLIILSLALFLFSGFDVEKSEFKPIQIKYKPHEPIELEAKPIKNEPGLYIICQKCRRAFYKCHGEMYIGEKVEKADCRPLYDYVPKMGMGAIGAKCPFDGGKPYKLFWNTFPPNVRFFTNQGWMAKQYRPKARR